VGAGDWRHRRAVAERGRDVQTPVWRKGGQGAKGQQQTLRNVIRKFGYLNKFPLQILIVSPGSPTVPKPQNSANSAKDPFAVFLWFNKGA